MSAISQYAPRLYRIQAGICPWCFLPLPPDLDGVEVDHIIPRARGGPSALWNLQLLHRDCNRGTRGKFAALTERAKALAAERGITLREPKPTSWPGSNLSHGRQRSGPRPVHDYLAKTLGS